MKQKLGFYGVFVVVITNISYIMVLDSWYGGGIGSFEQDLKLILVMVQASTEVKCLQSGTG